jgi:hypothetical protein
MTSEEKKKREMPKGGRKGGAIFPRIALKDALIYARKLVSKTHTAAQPRDVIFAGVVGSKSGTGNVRISALKQYGFLKGDNKSQYSADDLAKQIVASPTEELNPLYRQAILRPTIFKKLFDTFHGDAVPKSKLKQRAAELGVHPDETETCVELYVSGMATAGLASVEGDRVTHMASADISVMSDDPVVNEEDFSRSEITPTDEASEAEIDASADPQVESRNGATPTPLADAQSGPRAVFNVNVTLDSSMDIEKLQKQLELLKRFGAI